MSATCARPAPPVVVPLKVNVDRSGSTSVTIRCPLCGRRHVHGIAPGDSAPGHRVAHCTLDVDRVGYVIAEASA